MIVMKPILNVVILIELEVFWVHAVKTEPAEEALSFVARNCDPTIVVTRTEITLLAYCTTVWWDEIELMQTLKDYSQWNFPESFV
jgi:hypothetical protein